MSVIKVLIVEDDPDWARGLRAYLESQPDIAVAALASTPEDARREAALHMPDVVLMDIMLAESPAGIELTAELAASLGMRVIMLTSLEDKESVFDAFRAGAIDYQVKSSFERLPEAVRSAYRGRAPISADVAEQLREEFRRLKRLERDVQAKEVRDALTPTEMQVLRLIHEGHTQTEVANRLVVSLRTIKVHVGHILKKLGGGSSKEAAQRASELGLFRDEHDE